jgi:murein DD-endopeptidase
MADMPSLGGSQRGRRGPVVWVWLLLVAALAGGGYWMLRRHRQAPKPVAALIVDAGAAVAEAPKPPLTLQEQAAKAGLKHSHVVIQGPLESSVNDAAGPEVGPPLTQVATRALVWWMDVPADFRKGDVLDILYEERPNQEPVVHAVRYGSSKLDKTFRAYRFKAAQDTYPRLYQASGEELEQRLKDAPLEDYEQVTSHLRDGRKHKGVDFKTPVGTPVHAAFAGTITRKTWNFRGNGNSLEVTDAAGKKALYLHLSAVPKTTHVGEHVALGQVIAESGNTGHTFAPHLHYQLMQGDRLLDPFKVQQTYRRTLPEADHAAFDAEVHKLDAWMGAPPPQGAPP